MRKVSGYRKPSKANQDAFKRVVDEVTEAIDKLLGQLTIKP